ncbi:permease [Oceanispirochaeta sp.]|jgi:uncharacterized membrane protein YraQ (UPF0718 family)|uniref:permease n=1 Tax=Oceanispirochaeta sp. TaxID=2035350 RepID=UPI0026370427|nr:permease [Oceanispirochaeta sp.]MDA3955569.1 permease [Oceanispirochaeta sp.]
MKKIKKYTMSLMALGALLILYYLKPETAVSSMSISLSSAGTMLKILPPILLIINLLDIWIPKAIIIRHMGENAGLKGYFWAIVLGTFGAGPLYAAFPIAAILANKGARISYIIFFLGVWTTTKLPILMYELNFFGLKFTAIHVITGFIVFFIMSILMEKFLKGKKLDLVYEKLSKM